MKTRDVLAILGGCVAIALLVWLFSARGGDEPTPSPATGTAIATAAGKPASDGGGASDSGGVSYPAETAGTDQGAGPATDEDRAASSARADEAARVWVDHSLSAPDWQDRLRPQVTDEAWPVLALPDPKRVRPTEVTGAPEAAYVDADSAEYNVPTDVGPLRVIVVKGGDGAWRVSSIDKGL